MVGEYRPKIFHRDRMKTLENEIQYKDMADIRKYCLENN